MAGVTTGVDVAVVGAGVIGCMVARELHARAPQTSLMVLDRDTPASGASRRSAGLHFPRGATERIRHMAALSHDRYAALRTRHPGVPLHPLPMTLIGAATGERALRDVYLPVARLRRAGPVPGGPVRVPEGAAAWTGEGCHYADVHGLTQFVVRRLRAGGVVFREGARVTGLRPGERDVELRLGTGEVVRAGRVVLAPGPWLAEPAWRDLVAPLGARVKKVVALHVDVAPEPGDPVVVLHDEDAFLLPLHDRGHWLFSYTCPEWDVGPDAVTGGISARNLHEAHAVLARYAPELVRHAPAGRVFCDAYGPGREPLVGPLDPAGRVVFAGAAGGSGYRLAPAIAAEAAGLLLPKKPSGVPEGMAS
ncbi:hypothetical protein GCM10010218_37460 [Streptomyces mashuensis]|uniref:FAD dependent oxidoreductase domain-containing protein n=1 Tax=Streptomyces mashuensis TaxID=33904 RepID=A0A919B4I2_9ACTN|nr:FAD-dependent oxidoreductase [Streptomyces mashuensis]GHF52496.1 hypothetical protein GCM10010218_37460 [Streptomyces mashuensis]